MDKRRFTTAVGKYLINPIVKAAITLRLAPLGYAILKTTGRKAGCADRPRSEMGSTATPSGWSPSTVAARPTCATSKPTPRVRVKVRGTWRSGTAHILPHDDPRQRLRKIGLRFNGAVVQIMGTDLLTIRIDLDP